ncbi:efflux RND transporter periplasmic adaptor subunit [Nitratireductor sp. StC3]|uniref:efflux RND transporter periplasmic adaptor subunit n=1 Tax=Nitratireductor sp. StC3 TaxID=2126741 RepID=UPI000D0DB1E4|nr:efflux RND transporter periplasmic adaptor subunit [Nitratireductor sp. StC3]PSM17063.1 efflux transporter periplasmic adaptor subunit [Nitratireductor sp. StC3]
MRAVRILGLLAVAAAVAFGAYWYWSRPLAVATVSPTRGDAAEIVYAAGIVEPRNWAKVTALVRERIVWVCNCEGERVAEGDELVRLDDTEAAAVLAELKVRHALAAAERDRIALLVERNVVNQTELDRAHSAVAQLEALIAGQEARIANYVLTAPSDGVVLRQDAEVGEIGEPGMVLFWVGRPSPLIIVAEVNEEDIPRVETGQQALLRADAFAGRTLEATVDSITPKGDPVTKTYRVRLALPAVTPLRIGMSVDVNIVVRVSRQALLLPTLAVSDDTAFVVEGDTARQKALETGIRGTTHIEVLGGVDEAARVISPFPEAIEDGQRVRAGAGG